MTNEMQQYILEMISRTAARRHRVQRAKRKHRAKNPKLRMAARRRERKISPMKRRKFARKAMKSKRKLYGRKMRLHADLNQPNRNRLQDDQNNPTRGKRNMLQATQLIDEVAAGRTPKEVVEAVSPGAKTAMKIGAAGAGGLGLLYGTYKAGKLRGSIGRKAAFVKGFSLGTATGSVLTGAGHAMHKGVQAMGREQAIVRHAEGTAQIPGFSMRDVEGGYGGPPPYGHSGYGPPRPYGQHMHPIPQMAPSPGAFPNPHLQRPMHQSRMYPTAGYGPMFQDLENKQPVLQEQGAKELMAKEVVSEILSQGDGAAQQRRRQHIREVASRLGSG